MGASVQRRAERRSRATGLETQLPQELSGSLAKTAMLLYEGGKTSEIWEFLNLGVSRGLRMIHAS